MECDEEEAMESLSVASYSPTLTSSQDTHLHQQPHHNQTAAELSLPLLRGSPVAQQHEVEDVGVYQSPCSPQISLAEYNCQASDYTQQVLRELKASPEYKRHIQRCHSCGASWFDGEWSQGCLECGGSAMQLPCCICRGKCGKTWRRNVEMSHSMHSAHWDGECGHKAAAVMLKDMLQLASVMDGMEDLKT